MAEKKTKQDIGQELYFLKPVSHIRDISEQIKEIDRRLKILWDKRQSHDPPLPIAPIHIVAALGLPNKDVLNDWVNGEVRARIADTPGKPAETFIKLQADATHADPEQIRLMRERARLLALWLAKCETTYLDTAANPTYKGGQQGSIKGLEMCYGYKTTEQLEVVSKGDDLSIGLEAYRKRQAAKAKKTS